MTEKSKEYVVLRVTFTEDYLIPLVGSEEGPPDEDSTTEINGWSVYHVKDDWFYKHDPNSYHATRDGHRVGGGKRVLGVDIMAKWP